MDRASGDIAREARRLIRGADRAALATSFDGRPYVSLVLVAAAPDAAPLLLLSDLAQHTRNIGADRHVSLLFDGTQGYPDPLAGPRLTAIGEIRRDDDPALLARFAARHPSSEIYAGFADFHLYRVTVERGHFVAGFGRIDWIEGADLRFDGPAAALLEAAGEIVAHMNADHADAVALYAERLLGRGGTGWQISAIDPEGIDLRRDGETARLDFPAAVSTPAGARAALVDLAAKARGRPPGPPPHPSPS